MEIFRVRYILCSKSRVASKKPVTLPKLELCSAVLLAELVYRILSILDVNINYVLMWSDSNIALSWIKSVNTNTQVSKDGFISRRVELIRKYLCTDNWGYIPSAENPADLLTRGVNAKKLGESPLWWFGPPCIRSAEAVSNASPRIFVEPQNVDIVCLSAVYCEPMFLFLRYSSFNKLLRVTSYCLRFIENLKQNLQRSNKRTGHLTCEELNNAKLRSCNLTK